MLVAFLITTVYISLLSLSLFLFFLLNIKYRNLYFLKVKCYLCCRYGVNKMTNYRYDPPNYIPCCFAMFGSTCLKYNGLYSSIINYLPTRSHYIGGYSVSEYELIKSRCSTLCPEHAICPYHRYRLCEDYRAEYRCMFCCHHNILGLQRIGVRAAFFIRNVPICK
jgi:hypothetical protein